MGTQPRDSVHFYKRRLSSLVSDMNEQGVFFIIDYLAGT